MSSQLHIPPLAVVPFILLLAGIAVLPLAAPHFWERRRNQAVFSTVLAAPVALWLVLTDAGPLLHALAEYGSFIALLGSLYVVCGGIHLGGDLRGSPRNNTLILGVGAVLANLLGTTGASMLLLRLLLRTNSERQRTGHIPVFFIIVVSNVGGMLTPLGDPPLFLGYLRGVPFTWTLRLLPIWLAAVGYCLTIFYVIDRRAYAHERPQDLRHDDRATVPLTIAGTLNLVWLAMIVASVFLPTPARECAMVAAAVASRALGRQDARRQNAFTYGPIAEVAILFAGIFVTMVPALALLAQQGPTLGLSRPWHFFLVTGSLSSVLDNAPTYLTFLTTAQSTTQALGLPSSIVGVPASFLAAISAGAVLMGANTYIGNGPNFMVKAIADEAGYRTPSFLGYAWRVVLLLSPVYLATALLVGYY